MSFSVTGLGGQLGSNPFFEVRLSIPDCGALIEGLKQAAAQAGTITIAVTRENPNRLRLKCDPLPAYEARAPASYLRGDVLRVQGVDTNSCNLAISARFGVPLFSQDLSAAAGRARNWVLVRVPNRKYDQVEFWPDVDLPSTGEDTALLQAQSSGLVYEDFSDWENQ